MDELNPKQELFCQFYIKNDHLFGNATLAYAEAYEYHLDELSTEPPVTKTDDNGKATEWGDSEYKRAYNTCSVQGSKLLVLPKINERVRVLLNELLTDDIVDSELARIIKGKGRDSDKISAIKEYNALKQRVTKKVDMTTQGEKINLTDPRVIEIAKKYEEEIKEKL